MRSRWSIEKGQRLPLSAHVAVVDPLPMYQQGVVAVLSAAGYTVETPVDVVAWAGHNARGVVLLTLESETEWDTLSRLASIATGHVVIALVAEETPHVGARAIRAGARSVLMRRVTSDALRRTVEATVDGQAVLPAAVAAVLADGAPATGPAESGLSTTKLSWLRQLAAGATVTQLARSAGYSERAMFRLLQSVYQEIGASNRIQAIMHAQKQGWLRVGPD